MGAVDSQALKASNFFLFSLRKLKENQEMLSLLVAILMTWQMHDFVDGAAIQEEEQFHIHAWNKNRAADSEQDDWILLQHRTLVNDTDEFQEHGWEQYKNGFGDANGTTNGTAYWIGLEKMHQMTSTGKWQLLFIVRGRGKTSPGQYTYNYVIYDNFKIDSEMLEYTLHFGSLLKKHGFFGSEPHILEYHNGYPFSTKDRDNDEWYKNCASEFMNGGWWYYNCGTIDLNDKRSDILHALNVKGKVVVTETEMAMMKVE